MSIPNATLQKLLQEVESQAQISQQQINIVRSQITAKQRDIRMIKLTSDELGTLPKSTNVYEGVGKMFVAAPILSVNKRLDTESKSLNGDIAALEKRLQYLETTRKNSQQHIEKILGARS